MDGPHFLGPFTSWWRLGLFPPCVCVTKATITPENTSWVLWSLTNQEVGWRRMDRSLGSRALRDRAWAAPSGVTWAPAVRVRYLGQAGPLPQGLCWQRTFPKTRPQGGVARDRDHHAEEGLGRQAGRSEERYLSQAQVVARNESRSPARSLPDAPGPFPLFWKHGCQERSPRQPLHVTLKSTLRIILPLLEHPLPTKPMQSPPPEAPVLGIRPQCSCFLMRMGGGGLSAPREHSRTPDADPLCLHDAHLAFSMTSTGQNRTNEPLNFWLSPKRKALWRQKSGGLRALHTWLGEGGCPGPHTPSPHLVPLPCPPAQDQPFQSHRFSRACDHALFAQHTVAGGICSFPSRPRPACSPWPTTVATALRSSAGMKSDALASGHSWDAIWLNSSVLLKSQIISQHSTDI